MYPRNAASPEPIAIGPVVQISDGAVQSSGVTVRIKPVGVDEADGGGTTAYSTDGVVLYTPTQAETNYTSFVLIAKKTGCIPASVTVVTTASATAGYAGVDWSKVTSATTTVVLSGTTIKTATDIEVDTQDIQSRLPVALTGGRIDASVGAYQSGLAPLSAADTASAVWDALLATYTASGSFGQRVMRTDSASAGNGAKVTGAGHVAADIHELQAAVITDAAFAAGWLTAAGTAADYVTELQTAIGTATNQTAILDRVSFALSALAGNCSTAQTATETYVLSIGGNTYTAAYSGLDASGNRGTTTLTKA